MIKATREIIYHYTCSQCKNWWSWATVDAFAPGYLYCPHCAFEDMVEGLGKFETPVNWISVDDELPKPPIGRVHVLVEEEYIGQGMPKPPIKMLRMGDYSTECCRPGESGYWEDDYGNRHENIDEGGTEGNRVTHWAKLIRKPE